LKTHLSDKHYLSKKRLRGWYIRMYSNIECNVSQDSVEQLKNSVPSSHVRRERKETIEQLNILYLPITFGVSEKRLRGICSDDFKRKSSEEQNCSKSTRTELLNLCHSLFVAFRRVYHELLEKDAALQNVEDPHMRAELESKFEEESASTKRHTIGVMGLIGKLFVWKMITLIILCEGFMIRVLYVVTGYCLLAHAARASAASQLKFIILELIISTARNKTVFLFIAKSVRVFFKKALVAVGTHWPGCPAPLVHWSDFS
ncbi:hypothetical protein T01_5801, partial [Trichinella spiralis]